MPKGIKGFQKGHPQFSGYRFQKGHGLNKKENNPMWKGGKKDIACLHCERIFKGYKNKKYCSRQCVNRCSKNREMHRRLLLDKRGINSIRWTGGSRTYYSQIAKKSYAEYNVNITCEKCNTSKKICVHHKDENFKNNNIFNLQALCRSCHTFLHRKIK